MANPSHSFTRVDAVALEDGENHSNRPNLAHAATKDMGRLNRAGRAKDAVNNR
jgi:hypothetical protein